MYVYAYVYMCVCLHKFVWACVYVVYVNTLFDDSLHFRKKYKMFFYLLTHPSISNKILQNLFIIKLLNLSNKGMHTPFAFPSKCVEPL